MGRSLAASIVAFALAIGQVADARAPQDDPFLTEYYNDHEIVRCRDYETASGARLATYQWWLLGFVSGADHVRRTFKRPMARVDVVRVLALASDHCRAHPTDRLASAAIAVVDKLASAQMGK
jgi:hypothetical protein